MRKHLGIVLACAMSIGLVGCGTMNKQDVGTITGGAVGGLLGSQIGGGSGNVLATVGGVMLGAFLGNQIGHSMDVTDELQMQQAMAADRPVAWTNQKTGERYRVVPGKRVGSHCRDYVMYAYINGEKKPVHGRACRKHGKWVAMSR